MNVFLLPIEITKNIEKTLSNYWWKTSQEKNSCLIWMNWERMSKHKSAGGMGFRDFRDFNLAMLGKQGWRFITNPNNLVTKLYKARYFANTDFLNSELGHNPSFIWRIICESKDLIRDGVIWRIGTCVNINVVGQPWLANNDNPYITSDAQALEGRSVASLFQNGTKEWDRDVIKDVFNDRDQKCILDTRISDNVREDILCWSYEATGLYYVKSAYKWLQQKKEAWRSADRSSIFTKLWKIRAPPKAINVVWRALTNCLPTLVQLQTKRVQVQALCPVCQQENESILHSLVNCTYAHQCWSILKVDTNGTLYADFATWLEGVLYTASPRVQAEVITLCWTIWRNRNDIVWNQSFSSINRIVAAAKQYLTQWSLAQSRSSNTLLQPRFEGDGDCIWVNPQQNSVKVSVDATVFDDKDAAGLGLVARDDKGVLLLAKTVVWPSSVAPVLAEAMAIKEALSWIDEMQWGKVFLVSDCLVAIQAIRSKTPMRSQLGSIIEDCRSYLRRLNKVSLFHVKRSANMVAHQLARESYRYPGRSFDRDSIPSSVKHCIELDLNH